jgi:hypothetical protein
MLPDLSGKTEDTEFQMPSQKKQIDTPLAPSAAVSLGGTAAAPAAAPTASVTTGGGGDDDGPKDIDYTSTSDEYWRGIAESGRASEVWIPNLEKKGGAEETATVAKKYISGLIGSNWGTSSQAAASKKAINIATRDRGTGAISEARSASTPARAPTPAKAPVRDTRSNRERQNIQPTPKRAAPKRDTYGGSDWYSDR